MPIRHWPLLVLVCLATACAGDVVGPSDMHGQWLIVHPGADGARTETRMTFGSRGSFRSETLWYDSAPRDAIGYLRSAGGWRVDGDRLQLRIVHSEEWQKHAVGENPRATSSPGAEWADRGTVRVDGDRLIHTYVWAPLDAPEINTEIYQRVR